MASTPPPESSSPPPSPPPSPSPPRAIPLALPAPPPPPEDPQSPPPPPPQQQSSSPLQQSPSTIPVSVPPLSGSSSSQPPQPILAIAAPAAQTGSSRRLPPPCWSPDETVALIDGYRDKWYSLRRGNLKASHWQDVADAVSSRCPAASPPKTAVQCRHKMEKLRKRYRTEIQRARNLPVARFNSSWVHFKRMDAMEKGLNPSPSPNPIPPSIAAPVSAVKPENSDEYDDQGLADDEDDEDADQRLYEELKYGSNPNSKNMSSYYRNGIAGGGVNAVSNVGGGGGSGGFRIRIPTGVSIAQPGTVPRYAVPMSHPGVSFSAAAAASRGVVRECNATSAAGSGGGHSGGVKRGREKDATSEMVSAIKALGEGFVRMEHMKMEMAREIERMRMEMEMKRTEMILDSQHRIVDAFAKAVGSDNKKKKLKRMPSPET